MFVTLCPFMFLVYFLWQLFFFCLFVTFYFGLLDFFFISFYFIITLHACLCSNERDIERGVDFGWVQERRTWEELREGKQ